MAIDRTGISSLDTGASDITYTGDEGPKSPDQQLMASADPMLVEEYEKYVFELKEINPEATPVSFKQFVQQIMSGMAGGGIARPGYRDGEMVTAPKHWQSAPDHPKTELAYITDAEKNLLLKKDLHNSLKDGPNVGPGGIMSLNGTIDGEYYTGAEMSEVETGGKKPPRMEQKDAEGIRAGFIAAGGNEGSTVGETEGVKKQVKERQDEKFNWKTPGTWALSQAKKFASWNNMKQRQNFISSLTNEERETLEEQLGAGWWDDQTGESLLDAGNLNILNQFGYQDYLDRFKQPEGGGGGEGGAPGFMPLWQQQGFNSHAAWLTAQQGATDATGTASQWATDPVQLAAATTNVHDFSSPYFYGAHGGRIPAAYGGIMGDDGRRAYGLGSIFKPLKKAVKKIKKIVKSDIGKAALMAAAYRWGPAFLSGEGLGMGEAGKGWAGWKSLFEGGLDPSKGGMNVWRGIMGASALGGLFTEEEENGSDYLDWHEKEKQRYLAQMGGPWPTDPVQLTAQGGRIGYAGGRTARMIALNQLYGINDEDEDEDEVQYAQGGRIGYANGGMDDWYSAYLTRRKNQGSRYSPSRSEYESYVSAPIPMGQAMPEGGFDEIRRKRAEQGPSIFAVPAAQGGRIGYANGGMDEMDDWYSAYLTRRKNQGSQYSPSRSEYESYVNTTPMFYGGGLRDQRSPEELRRERAEQGPGKFAVLAAQGGRIGAQEGGLMNLGGMEKDYRQEGGFVPLGGEERADDVPARLSKNEFVFTADAVRAAGGGDIDAGAEVMENVMENLEEGGQVSEESQGLEGARDMFATAQRLEGVL